MPPLILQPFSCAMICNLAVACQVGFREVWGIDPERVSEVGLVIVESGRVLHDRGPKPDFGRGES